MPTFTSGNDTYTVSTAGNYDLDMLGGDDRLNVYGGTTVTAHLGDGNDYTVLKAALITIFGDAGEDRFDIYASNATVDGGADDDSINVRGGTGLTATGGLGDDRFNFIVDTSSIAIDGGEGNDAFVGYHHSITGNIMGGAGNDSFVQFIGGVTLFGGLGNDTYQVGVTSHAAIFENAGEGNDTVQVARGYSYTLQENFENLVVASLAGSTLGPATLNGNELANYITAGNNDDSINGLDGNDHLFGKGGNDTVDGGNGNDLVDGGAGNDTLIGGAGNDTLVGRTGDDALVGGAGNDIYYVDSSGDSIIEAVGGGTDTVRTAIDYDLPANVEIGIVQGSVGLQLEGNSLDNQLFGGSGDDTLYGNGGIDILKGGLGNDLLNAGTGSVMLGGLGDDTYEIYSRNGGDIIEQAGQGIDTVNITAILGDVDYVLPANVEDALAVVDASNFEAGGFLTGNELDNTLTFFGYQGCTIHGGPGNDILTMLTPRGEAYGGDGNDTLVGEGGGTLDGGDGDDNLQGDGLLKGGEGNDVIVGGSGFDKIRGGLGADNLTGGSGADIFYFDTNSMPDSTPGAVDSINDFVSGTGSADDTLYLVGIDANTLIANDQAFTWIGIASFSHSAGELRVVYGKDGASCHLYGDTNGDAVADFELSLHLTGIGLNLDDIIL